MRTIVVFALLLVTLPALVLVSQHRRAHEGIGDVADYLEIETPTELDPAQITLDGTGIPILCYHYLTPRPSPLYVLRVIGAVVLNLPTISEKQFWSLPVDVFESHLKWLSENGYTSLSAEELVEIAQGRRDAPEKAVCITFDDGDRSLLDLGLPLLERYDMKATLFVVTSHVGARWKDLSMMNWGELQELMSSGRVTVESHTHQMHYKVKVADGGMQPVHQYWGRPGASGKERDQLVDDLDRSRASLARNLHAKASLLAWPYGFADASIDELARQAGFEATFSLRAGRVHAGSGSTWSLPRYTITARTTATKLERMLAVPGDAGSPSR